MPIRVLNRVPFNGEFTLASALAECPSGFGQAFGPSVTATIARDDLIPGTYDPGPTTTGVPAGTVMTVLTGNRTYSTAGQTITDTDFFGRVSVTAADITFKRCRFRGTGTASSGLVTATNAGALRLLLEDCTIKPDTPNYLWNGVVGHDYTLRRCDISYVTDGFNIYNASATRPYHTGVIIEQTWIHDLAWWTGEDPDTPGATGPFVHPTDSETHNDLIQHMGGTGTIIRFNTLDARYARQYAHWVTTTTSEPFTSVALYSLPDGGPYQHIPDRNITLGTALTNGVPSNEANGRYNYDDLACLMIGNEQGPSYEISFTDNLCIGGVYAVNGGGNPRIPGQRLGEFKRNRFARDQGGQGAGANTTQTLNFQGSGWLSTDADIPLTGPDANVYADNGDYVTVRF